MQPGRAEPQAPTETVSRPDPGLARGKWEAPPWALWTIGGVVLVVAALYLLRRLGFLRLGKRKPE